MAGEACKTCNRVFGTTGCYRCFADPELCRLCDLVGDAEAPGGTTTTGWPLKSDALAVHPKQVAEAEADAKKKGVPTEFDGAGRPIFRDRGHRRDYLKAYRYIDQNSFTGY